jgi:hypothetical protein
MTCIDDLLGDMKLRPGYNGCPCTLHAKPLPPDAKSAAANDREETETDGKRIATD